MLQSRWLQDCVLLSSAKYTLLGVSNCLQCFFNDNACFSGCYGFTLQADKCRRPRHAVSSERVLPTQVTKEKRDGKFPTCLGLR